MRRTEITQIIATLQNEIEHQTALLENTNYELEYEVGLRNRIDNMEKSVTSLVKENHRKTIAVMRTKANRDARRRAKND